MERKQADVRFHGRDQPKLLIVVGKRRFIGGEVPIDTLFQIGMTIKVVIAVFFIINFSLMRLGLTFIVSFTFKAEK